jgi:hypothetical protein
MLKIKEEKMQELESLGFKKCKSTGGYIYISMICTKIMDYILQLKLCKIEQ